MTKHPKIIVVIGPTASGKSELAVTLAKKYHGEIISADSRQVYRGLDIGTGKVRGQWKEVKNQTPKVKTAASHSKNSAVRIHNSIYMYKGIPHYCIDYVSPKKQYTVTHFKHDAELAIEDIIHRGKTPIVCGGTGLYVDAVLLNQNIPEVEPNPAYRKKLEAKSTAELFTLLQKKDPIRAKTIDPHNPRRLIRALEIIKATGKPVPELQNKPDMSYMIYETSRTHTKLKAEIHYLRPSRAELNHRIEKRLKQWLRRDVLLVEIKQLRASGVSWKRIREFGLEYTYAADYLQKKIDRQIMYTQSLKAIQQYAKRQETWFRKYE